MNKKLVGEIGGYTGMVLLQGATLPSIIGAIINPATADLPPLSMVLMVWIGLLLYFARAFVQRDWLYMISYGIGVGVNFLDARLGDLKQMLAVKGGSGMSCDIDRAHGLPADGVEHIDLVAGGEPDLLTVIRQSMHCVHAWERAIFAGDFGWPRVAPLALPGIASAVLRLPMGRPGC